MKRPKYEYIALLLAAVLLFVGCGAEERLEESALPVTQEDVPDYSDIFVSIEEFASQPHVVVIMSVGVGEEFVVSLGSNPTTGYQWQENATISDKDVVEQVGHEFVASGSNMPGSPGHDVWTFEGLKNGTTVVSMECSRPWEEKGVDERTITITIAVK